jgi:hypothetical protein
MQVKKLVLFFILFTFFSCTNNEEFEEGAIVFGIDYPNNKDNFFLYHVLPKEMVTSFNNDVVEMKIKKANMENTILLDNINKKMMVYYNYGDVFNCHLTNIERNKLISIQPNYEIKFLAEKDTFLGFNIKKAVATDPNRPFDPIEIWYTEDVKIKESNWFNGFEKIPGFLLKYHAYQNGLKMEFKAKKIIKTAISDSVLTFKRPGKSINYQKFDSIVVNLFETFK